MRADRNDAVSEPWDALSERCASAFEIGDIGAGRLACERLLAREGVPSPVRQRARRDQVRYAPRLDALVPSVAARAITFDVPAGWSRFNPSIAANDDGYRMIVRSSNFTNERMRYTMHDPDGIVRTRNYLLDLDADLTVRRVALITDDTDRAATFPGRVQGFEDCRLVRYRGAWWAAAASREHNARHFFQVVWLRLEGDAFGDARLLDRAAPRWHEKNWMPLVRGDELLFVRSCRPTVVLRYDDDRLEAVAPLERRAGPALASDFRGGSQAVAVDGGYLCVVHEAVNVGDRNRVYPHRFVLIDERLAVARVSPQFVFFAPTVEFCAGLARRGDTLTLSFGSEDRAAHLATMRLDDVLAILGPVDGTGVARWRPPPATDHAPTVTDDPEPLCPGDMCPDGVTPFPPPRRDRR